MTLELDGKINERLQKFCDMHLGGTTPTIGLLNDMAAVFGHKLRISVEPARKTPEETFSQQRDR